MGARTIVPPEDFVAAMKHRWTGALGNTISPPLETLWSTMARTFNDAILHGDEDHKWRVLQPPTGSGKTQGACVYASLVVARNRVSAMPTGMLIVVRTIQQADEVVRDIRSLLRAEADVGSVVAKHSRCQTKTTEMAAADVLVITHEAYVRALMGLEANTFGRWSSYVEWAGGRRLLTVIDETLSGVIEQRQVSANDIKRVLTVLTPCLRVQFADQVQALQMVLEVLEEIESQSSDEDRICPEAFRGWHITDSSFAELPRHYRMRELREAIRDLPFDDVLRGNRCEVDRKELADKADETLDGVERMLGEWSYVARHNGRYALHHSFFLAPTDLPGPVVLDATATQNYLWTLLQDRAVLVSIPDSIRLYDNVRVRVARVRALGKEKLSKRGKHYLPKVMEDVVRRTEHDAHWLGDDRVLMVLHKDVRCHAATDDPRFDSFKLANWGGVDGKNDWSDFGTVVLFGLHNLPDIWAHNMFGALQGLPSREWFETGAWKGAKNVQREMHRRQLTASIIQAINRVRCRRTVDASGRCQPTMVYLALKPGDEGDQILDYIREEMPGIEIEEWPLELEGPRQMLNDRSYHPKILTYMEHRRPGQVSINTLVSDLGLPQSYKRELRRTLADPSHPLSQGLHGLGVVYINGDRGRGNSAHLLKAV